MEGLWAVVKVFVKGWIHSASAGFLMLSPNQTWWSHIFHILFDFFNYLSTSCISGLSVSVCQKLNPSFVFLVVSFFFLLSCVLLCHMAQWKLNKQVRESVFVCECVGVWVCARTCSFPVYRVPRSHFALDNSPLRMGGTQSLYSPQGHMTRGLRRETTPVTVAVLWQITSRASQQRAHYAWLMPDLSAWSDCCFNKFQANADKREDENVLV